MRVCVCISQRKDSFRLKQATVMVCRLRDGGTPGAGIMEADDRQVTTVFVVQPSFHHRDAEYDEALPSSANVQPHLASSFADDDNAS